MSMGTVTKGNPKVGMITLAYEASDGLHVAICTSTKGKIARLQDTDLSILRKQTAEAIPGAEKMLTTAFRAYCGNLRAQCKAVMLHTRLYMRANRTKRAPGEAPVRKVGKKIVGKKKPAAK
jgi:hypothetical protein